MKWVDLQEARYAGADDDMDRIKTAVQQVRSGQESEVTIELNKSNNETLKLIYSHLGDERWEDTDFGDMPYWQDGDIRITIWYAQPSNPEKSEVIVYEEPE